MTTAWLDRVAADLLDTEAWVRKRLRDLSRARNPDGSPTHHSRLGATIALSQHAARTLLRGAMPAPIATGKLRAQHARMVLAMQAFGAHLVGLNDTWRPGHDVAIGAGVQLLDELREWLRQANWMQAARAAGVNWAPPRGAITTVQRQRALEQTLHAAPNPHMGRDHTGSAAALADLARLRDAQLALDLPPPPSAELVDLRQLRLQLTPAQAA